MYGIELKTGSKPAVHVTLIFDASFHFQTQECQFHFQTIKKKQRIFVHDSDYISSHFHQLPVLLDRHGPKTRKASGRPAGQMLEPPPLAPLERWSASTLSSPPSLNPN